jgi:hypothetical protein
MVFKRKLVAATTESEPLGRFRRRAVAIPARDARVPIVRECYCAAAMLCENTSPYSAADCNIELPRTEDSRHHGVLRLVPQSDDPTTEYMGAIDDHYRSTGHNDTIRPV